MKVRLSSATLIKLGVAGYLVRIIIWSLSFGSNDIRIWHNFASLIQEYGVYNLYNLDLTPIFNHPPLMGLYSTLCLSVADNLGVSFSYIFRLIPLLSDMGTGGLIYHYLHKSRKNSHIAAWGFLIYSWSIPPALISSFHGNTDALCTFFLVSSIVAWEIYRKFTWMLLLLLASINIKIIPLILFPAAALNCKSKQNFLLGGLIILIGLASFIIGFIISPSALFKNIFMYSSAPQPWGINFLFLMTGQYNDNGDIFQAFRNYAAILIVLAIIVAASFLQLIRKSTYLESVLASFLLFFILAPGFAVQYFIYLSPLVLMYSIELGIVYSIIAGLSCLQIYIPFTKTLIPWETVHTFPFPLAAILTNFIIWLLLIYVIYKIFRNSKSTRP